MQVPRPLLPLAVALSASAAEPTNLPWSLETLGDPTPPVTAAQSPIDAFVTAALEGDAIVAAPPADRRTLIRRASYDLTGLPPDPEAVAAFVGDPRTDAEAFSKVVDDLLASPHYGEHWGQHWLDVVRYADTAGENSDHPVENAWRYRNWVIDAFNSDKPYDEFVQLQIAGDLLAAEKPEAERDASIIATGYLAISRRFGHDIDKRRYLTYEDTIDNLGKAFLGLSISCARCHDHKHDPISSRDYYSLYSVFDSTRFSFPGCEPKQQPRDLVPLIGTAELAAERAAWGKRRERLQAAIDRIDTGTAAAKLRDLAVKSSHVLSQGEIPDGGTAFVTEKSAIEVDLRKGEAIQLSVLPQGSYGADTTIPELAIALPADDGHDTVWTLDDLIDPLLGSNPLPGKHGAEWCFLDTAGDLPKFLLGKTDGVDGKGALQAWENGAPPSVLVNRGSEIVQVWTKLPPRSFFCHPGPAGPVTIAWLSPVDGRVRVDLRITDGHPGGPDGVGWRLEHVADTAMAQAYRDLGDASASRPAAERALADHLSKEPTAPFAYAVAEGEPRPAQIHVRGDPEDLGEVIPRDYLAALGGGPLGDGSTSGRLELAKRITATDNPLTARVMANRIWGWHFGRGLVATPNDFGNHGTLPSHPELLDDLARRFIDSGWSVKAMHRLVMNSATYRQAAGDDEAAGRYAAFARRRLTAEELRDSLLVASGLLDRSPGGAHPFPARGTWSFTQHAPFAAEYATSKRSVYLMRKRNRESPFFALFDGSDPNTSTPERGLTTVPTQALFFMNDPFFHDCADQFAARVRAESLRIEMVCQQLFARSATPVDHADFGAFEQAMRPVLQLDPEAHDAEIWRSYARILLSSNEFLFID